MKLTIDFTNKVVTVEHQCTAEELFSTIKELFPNDKWKEYKIEVPIQCVNNPTWIPYVSSFPPYNPCFQNQPFPITLYHSGTTKVDCVGIATSASN